MTAASSPRSDPWGDDDPRWRPDPARVAALRAELGRRGLAGFVVPRADEHQGEYVPARAQRLRWLTGFSGSAGLAVILAGRAALFVDGRYTLQARAEVDRQAFEIHHLVDEPPGGWIADALPAGARFGFDPWLHTPDDVQRLRAACEKAGAALVPCADGNPVDAVWDDRPGPPLGPVEPFPEALAGRSSAEKRREAAAALAADRTAAAVLTAPDSIAWLLNVRGSDLAYTPVALAFAILHADGRVGLFVDPRKVGEAARAHLGDGVAVAPPAAFAAALDGLGAAKAAVRVDFAGAPAWVVERLTAAGAKAMRGDDPCALPKARKNEAELAGIRAAHRRDGAALVRFLAWLAEAAPRGDVTETSAAARLEDFRRRGERFRGLSFPTISAAGANGAIVHYRVTPATDRRLEPGTLYLVDSGAQYLDGTTDVTRTVAIGAPSPEMRDRFTRVLKGHIALATARFPKGTCGPQLDTLARVALWQAGLDYDHGTGHGVGHCLGVHEGPQRISKLPNRVPLEPGMVVSDEPGYYKAGAYGIRIENLVAVTVLPPPAGAEREFYGFETLTLAPIDLALVEPALLAAGEAAWLDAYHARVRREVGPLLDGAAAAWLETATRPVGRT
jgi:Xaa-Pro aminopeptidase